VEIPLCFNPRRSGARTPAKTQLASRRNVRIPSQNFLPRVARPGGPRLDPAASL
jgi:hypothetical protein